MRKKIHFQLIESTLNNFNKPICLKQLLLILLLAPILLFSQEKISFRGQVLDAKGEPLLANIIIQNTTLGTIADIDGKFILTIQEDQISFPATIIISYAKIDTAIVFKNILETRSSVVVNLEYTLPTIIVIAKDDKEDKEYFKPSTYKLDPQIAIIAPTVGGSIEQIIALKPGVRGAGELSDKYSVRGGNYDENLVYVNDFEIYRPFLTRAGQQEGLSFINPDLVQDVTFSTGGFEAKYGDKLSSVLDIKYKRPTKFKGSVTGSLRGAGIHLEGTSKTSRFKYLIGVRYKNSAAILKSLDTKGQYNPNAYDVQTNLIWLTGAHTEVEVLFNHSSTFFNLVPSESQTTSGAINQAIRFSVFFDGSEKDVFRNTMGGLAFKYFNERVSTKFLASTFKMSEDENFNIIGEYRLDEVETDFSSDDFGDVKATLGVGTFQDWGRNELEATVANLGHKGTFDYGKHLFQWGASFQYEMIEDQLSEWERIDSAGYSLPYTGEVVSVFNFLKSEVSLSNWRTQGYLQNIWNFEKDSSAVVTLNIGVRYHYWNFNNQLIVSPRAQLGIRPIPKKENRSVTIKFAAGMYEQPPFYREVRDREGVIQPDVKAQRSIHVVAGTEFQFKTWNDRNFRLSTEAFYKHLSNINPYELDDIRIRYYGNNDAKGYAYGVDMRLYGELVPGTDSWISMSYLRIREDLASDFYTEYTNTEGEIITPFVENQVIADTNTIYPGSIAKPTEQAFNFGLYFSDYMTKNQNFKMHLALTFGTGLPYGPPDGNRYTDVLRAPGYKRVDIGFSALLVGGNKEKERKREGNFGNHFDKVWLSAEIFNLLGNRNTIGYRWIKDTQNINWALPNYLTSRRFNIKLHIKFS